MISLSDFLPSVQLQASGCPKALMLQAIRNAVRELAETNLWTEDLYEISLAAGYPEYDIELLPDTALVTIRAAKYNGVLIDVFNSNDMDDGGSGWRNDTGTALTAVVVDDDKVVRAYPTPSADEAAALLLNVSLKPTTTATTCGDVFADWEEVITHGALARLKAMPEKPWSMQNDVSFHETKFNDGKDKASARVLKGRSDKPMRSAKWGKF